MTQVWKLGSRLELLTSLQDEPDRYASVRPMLTAMAPCPARTVDDLSVGSNVFGMFVAALAVVSSGMQQIYVGTMQAKHKLNANELLSNTAPAQACPPPLS